MYFGGKVENIEIYRNQERPGFTEPFHKVKFTLQSNGIEPVIVNIWVHPNYPESEIVKVAKTFLHRRLLDLVELTNQNIYQPEEIDALWQTVKSH